jgi:SM-20-related protein
MTTDAIAQQLGSSGLCICPNFLPLEPLQAVVGDLRSLLHNGQFKQAGIGRGPLHQHDGKVRNDNTYWLERDQQNQVQDILWQRIDQLQLAFNRQLFLGLKEFEGHYAAYPEGGFYDRHLDCFRGDSGRVVSFVLYLNSDWQSGDGGQLRVYGADSHFDVDPIGGTLVCFLSQEAEHEVLVSHRPRLSLTGWFKR